MAHELRARVVDAAPEPQSDGTVTVTEPTTREELVAAVDSAIARLERADDALALNRRSLFCLRDRMVARTEFDALSAELRAFDDARDVRVLRRSDQRRWRRCGA